MSAHLARARLLLDTHRAADAEQEARAALAENPADREAHHVFCSALLRQKKLKEARAAAGELVALAPDWTNSHLMRCAIEIAAGKYKAAEKAAGEALRLEPMLAAAHQNLAVCHVNQGRWSKALEEIEIVLATDPTNVTCTNLRAVVLSRLGRGEESLAVSSSALQQAPGNARTHAAAGWVCLEQKDYNAALEHFVEAMRLEPTNDDIRRGLVQALRARNAVYRIILTYSFWISRQPRPARFAVVAGLFFVSQFFRAMSEQSVSMGLKITAALIYSSILIMFCAPSALFNLLLLFDRRARHALSDKERRDAKLFVFIISFIALAILLFLVLFSVVIGFSSA